MSLKILIYKKEKKYNGKRFLNKIIVTYLISILMIGTVLPIVRSDLADLWWNSEWNYRKEISIDHTKVDANLAHFPVLIALSTDNNLTSHAQSDGDDIVFTDKNGNKLNHEIESFQSATGRLIAWVNVPSLSSSTDTILYMYYGNSACSSQQDLQGTWNSDYLMVHHMNETGNIYDSTSHALNAVNYGTTTDTNGMIDGCRYFDSLTDRYDFGNPSLLNPGTSSWTITLWTKITHVDASYTFRKWGSSAGFIIYMYNGGGASKYNYLKVSDGLKTIYRYWNTTFSDGNWHYLTAVINRNTNQLDMYLDGNPHNGYAWGNLAGMGSITTTANCLLYGGTNGRNDEFTVSTTIRNASWIKTSYVNQNTPSAFFSVGSEEQVPVDNHRPLLSNENPQNGSEVDYSQSSVSVSIQDPDGDPFNWYIHGPYVINGQQTGASNGTKTANLVSLPPDTEIIWYVNVTDSSGSGEWTNETYSFFTNSAPSTWWNSEWNYRKEIIIDHTKVDANLANFPVLIALSTDSNLASHAQSDGDDIVFTDINGNKLNHEIELFTSSSGRLIAWVNVPSLSSSSDTIFYIYYGNSACSNQQNPQGTWNSDYLMVHHMEETGNIIDSTSHGLNAVNYGTTTELNGKIDGCRYFDSLSDRYDFGNTTVLNPGLSSWTITLWTKISYVNSSYTTRKWGSNAGFIIYMYNGGGTSKYNYLKVGDGVKTIYRYWNASFSDGNWHYLTAVINRNTNQLDMYLDGVPHNGYASGTLSGMGNIATSANFLLYGGTNGRHDEFTISTTVRNANWIKTSYNNQNNPSGFFDLGNEEKGIISNQRPILTNEIPQNGSIIGINQPNVKITIQDPDGDPFDWTISGPYVITASQTGANNGTKTANLLTPLPPNTEIVWYVHVTDPSGSGKWTNATYHSNTITTVMPTLKYVKNLGIGISAVGPLAADVNNDGKMEIIRSGENGITVLDGATGNVLWTKSVNMWNDHCPMEAIDLNKDGILEIITSNGTGTWALYGNNGSVYWYNPNAPLQNKYCVAGDINADGYPEVYVCAIGSVTALTHDGQIFAQTWTYYPCFGGLTLGDTDYDGVFELYQNDRSNYYPQEGSGGRGIVAYWASNLTYRWSHPEVLASSHCATLIDVDKDGKLDVVIQSQSGGGFCVYNSTNGNIIHQTLRIPGVATHSQPVICDIDEDGNQEIIACREWSKPVIFDLYTWQVEAFLPWDCWETPAVADIDADGHLEIITCDEDNISIFNHHYQLIGNISLTCPAVWGMNMWVVQDVDNDGLIELVFNRISSLYVYDTITPAPTPRTLTQFNFFSQLRGRDPHYVPYGPLAPVVLNINPTNKSTNIPYNPQLSVYIYDYQLDLMTLTIKTNASTGVWHTLRTYSNVHEGTFVVNTTGMDTPHKTYWWIVNVSDSTGKYTYKLLKFTTIGKITISNEKPADQAIDIELNPQLSLYVEQRNGLPMTIRFRTNASGSWIIIGSNVSVYNGTYKQKPTTMSNYNKKYFWDVQCYDGQYWTNETFCFSTYKPSTAQWWNLSWAYRKSITVNHTKINTNLINFPVVINLPSDTYLAAHAQPNGNDIVFTDKNGNKLNHEIEFYQSATGRLVAWVNVPSLSSLTDTSLFLYYGNSQSGNQQNPQGTWNSDYLMVHHMNETGNIIDSTSHGLNAVNFGTTTEPNGKIDGCRYFDSLGDRYDFGNNTLLNPGMSSWTITLWTKIVHVNNYDVLIKWGSNAGFFMSLLNGTGGYNYIKVSDGTRSTFRYWNAPWSNGNWHQITAVINRNTNKLDVYLDGDLHNDGGTGNISGFGNIASTTNFRLYGGTNGRHDEFTISTTVRNASWIKTNYNNQNDPSSFYKINPEEPIPPAAVNMSNPVPQNGGVDIQFSPKLRITVTHNLGYLMNINWKTNASGSWTTIGSNSSISTGAYSCSNTAWVNTYYKTYWWRVEVHDYHGHWMNATFSFRTIVGTPTHGTPLLVLSNRKLICYNQSTVDPNGFRVYNTYQWIKNSQSITRLLLSFNTMKLTNVKDYSGYNNNGAITGATWVPDGVVGGAYSFGGIDSTDYISIPHSTSLDGGGAWDAITIEQWVNLSDNQTGRIIISKMSSSSEAKRSYEIGIANSMPANKLYGGVVIGNNSYKEAVYNTSLEVGQWYHVALTYKSGVGVKLYLNGLLIATNANQTTGNIQASPGKILCIGAYNGSGSYLAGLVDEVKIYPIVLTPQQINQDYLQERNGISSSSTMVDEETATGEQWKCAITPNNTYFDGVTKTSNTITIPN